MFDKLIEKLKADKKTIVFTEGTDARILSAASRLLADDLMGVILLVITLINAKKPAGKEVTLKEFKNPMLMFVIICVYVAMMITIGFFPATLIFMPVSMLFMGYRRPLPIICTTIGMNLFVWVLFVYSLKVRLPEGADFMSFLHFLY